MKRYLLAAALLGLGCGGSSNNSGTYTGGGGVVTTTTSTTTSSTGTTSSTTSTTTSSSTTTSTTTIGSSTFNLVLSGVNNAILTTFTNNADSSNTGSLIPNAAAPLGFSGQITITPQSGRQRFLDIRFGVSNLSVLTVGSSFPADSSLGLTPHAQITYGEQNQSTPEVFLFASTGGTVRLTSLAPASGTHGTIGLDFQSVTFSPTSQSGNLATGSLTINGPALLTF